MIERIRRHSDPSDAMTVGYLVLLLGLVATHLPELDARMALPEHLLELGGAPRAIPAWVLLVTHGASLVLVLSLVAFATEARGRFWHACRHWYLVLLVPTFYKQLLYIIPAVHTDDMDWVLLELDSAIGGDALVRGLSRVTCDPVTNVLNVCWSCYALLPFLTLVPLYRRGLDEFRAARLALLVGWLVCYVGYLLCPAIGMGYYLDRLGAEGTGPTAVVAVKLKSVFDFLEGRMRDSYPSGHTAVAIAAIWANFRFRLPLRWVVGPIAFGTALATVYLRYHYVVDLLAGGVLGLAGVAFGEALLRRCRRRHPLL